jgi:hypothetical protein
MRLAILALLLSSAPAIAWDGPGFSPWSLSLEERRGDLSFNAELVFTRDGKGWRVQGSCTVVDPHNHVFLTQTANGTATRSEGGIRGKLDKLVGFYVDQDSVVWGTMLCPSGEYHLGTGD